MHWHAPPLAEQTWPSGHVPPQAGAAALEQGVTHWQAVPFAEHT